MKKFILFFVAASLSSCLTIGKRFPSRLDWIEKDKTTLKDVKLVLGKPSAVGNSGGTETWTYAYYSYTFWYMPRFKELKFYWNKDQTIKHYSFTSSFPGDISLSQHEKRAKKKTHKPIASKIKQVTTPLEKSSDN